LSLKPEVTASDQTQCPSAVLAAQRHINEGYNHIVDIDLKTFFDEVDHCILLQLLYRKVKCPLTLRLIRKWLKAPILINGKLTKRRKGVPQGSPLSRYYPTSCYMNWTRNWKDGNYGMSATLMTLVSIRQ